MSAGESRHANELAATGHLGAYGVGVEYAYTMVHGAPATKFPGYVVPSALAEVHK